MKENMWLLIVLIIIFIVLQVLFFKALDFDQFDLSFELKPAMVDDIKQKVSEAIDPKPTPKKQAVNKPKKIIENPMGDVKELYRMAKKLVNDKKYKDALVPINELLNIHPETPKYWYEKIRALYGMQDCEVMGAMVIYMNMCKTSDDCFEGGVEWSEKTYDHLKKTYCKN